MEQQTFNLVIAVSIVLLTVACFVFMILAIKMLREGNTLAPVIGGRIPRQRRMRQRMEGLQEERDHFEAECLHLREVRENNFVLLRDQEVKIEELEKNRLEILKFRDDLSDKVMELKTILDEKNKAFSLVGNEAIQCRNRLEMMADELPKDSTNAKEVNHYSSLLYHIDNIIKAVTVS